MNSSQQATQGRKDPTLGTDPGRDQVPGSTWGAWATGSAAHADKRAQQRRSSAQDERLILLQLQSLASHALSQNIANIGFATMLVGVTWHQANRVAALTWLGSMVLLAAYRLCQSRVFQRARYQRSLRGWTRFFTYSSAASGVLWGLGAFALLGPRDFFSQSLYGFVLAGMGSGAATTNAVYRPAFLAFLLPSALLMALRMFTIPGAVELFLGVGCAFALALYVRVGIINHRTLRREYMLRLEKADLLSRLSEAHIAMDETNSSLERRVAERTQSLEVEIRARYEAERKLQRSHRMEAAARLTGGIAHDFNNLLTVVLSCLELVSPRDPKDEVMIGQAKRAATKGAALTQQLLACSATSSGKAESIELGQLLEELLRTMIRPILRENIKLEFRNPGRCAHVQVQRTDLETALLSLLLNARDALPKGGRVQVQLCHHEREVAIELLVQGPRLDASRLQEALGRDHELREDSSNSLCLVRGFALRAGGDIRAESSAQGTCFYLTLPVHEAAGAGTWSRVPNSSKVLVVEDNPALLESTARLVEDLGYESEVAANADEALKVLQRMPIDILLSDIRMPGALSGLDLAQVVCERWPDIKILLVTGHAPELSGSTDFRVLRKPYAVSELTTALHESANETALTLPA